MSDEPEGPRRANRRPPGMSESTYWDSARSESLLAAPHVTTTGFEQDPMYQTFDGRMAIEAPITTPASATGCPALEDVFAC
jgi:hypothetical protein